MRNKSLLPTVLTAARGAYNLDVMTNGGLKSPSAYYKIILSRPHMYIYMHAHAFSSRAVMGIGERDDQMGSLANVFVLVSVCAPNAAAAVYYQHKRTNQSTNTKRG